jgi:phenylalanyl-tRNA synthetase beta chain
MKFTLSWLKDHLNTDADIDAVVEAMTLAGLEVEGVENPAEALSAFTIAKVISAVKHPDADKLKVCDVDTVDGRKTIVCGAPNARSGMTVAYAPMGAYIPGSDFSLDKKPRKIRGVESSGMMCSGAELGLSGDHDGILDLDESFPMGQPIAEAMGLDEPVIDFEVTPNRPDWLGVAYIARDLAATGLGEFIQKPITPVKASFKNEFDVHLKTEACPAFAYRVVRGVKNGESPQWLRERLEAIGLRPISALVDITNYITFDRARPLHFYDLDKVSGDITVRMGADEAFEALDDKSYTASGDDVAITDASGIVGLGGIVGGQSTGVDENTSAILIECAIFDPLTIRRTAKRLAVNSDAKYRFERGVDSGFVHDGVEMATQMVLDICGGEASDVRLAGEIPASPADIEFDPARVEQLTGMALSDQQMETILMDLGFGVSQGKLWTVSVPTWRRDSTQPADLVEEIARIAGYHNLAAVSLPPLGARREPTATLTQNRTRHARRALALRGLSEAVTWSFCDTSDAQVFGVSAPVRVANPISSDLDVMRPSALIHLLHAGQRAADRGYPGAALFELGPVFSGQTPEDQRLSLAGARRVEAARDWQGAEMPDALLAKADALAALAAMGAQTSNLQIGTPSGSYWHPGRSGRLQMGSKNALADFGEVHPAVLKAMGISGRVVAFELWPAALPAPRKKNAGKTRAALAMSDLMPLHRDFAFLVGPDVSADAVIRAARGADKALISDVTLFDVYEGLDGGQRSLAIDVELTPKDATLTDKDIEAVSAKIVAKVEKAGGTLRS